MNKWPLLFSKVRCLKGPSFAGPEIAKAMVRQEGEVIGRYPAKDSDEEDQIGIKYPMTPYPDNTIASALSDEGVTWERIS